MLITVKEIISQSWSLYKTNIKKLSNIIIYFALVIGVLTFAEILLVINPLLAIPLAIPAVLLAFTAVVALIYINIVLTLACWNLLNNQLLDWNALYASSYKKLGRYILIAFVTGLIVLGGFILLVIPGFIFAVWYQFATLNQITTDEKLTVSKALTDSKILVVGRWWQTAWRSFAPQIVFGIIIALIGGIISGIIPGSTTDYTNVLITVFVPGSTINYTNLIGVVADNLASIILTTITAPLLIFPLLLLYKSLKANPVVSVDKI